MVANQTRRAAVQKLRRVAGEYDIRLLPDTAAKSKVLAWVEELLETDLDDDDRQEVEAALEEYKKTWPGAQQAEPQGSQKAEEWFFHAAQATYNCETGRWASKDMQVLEGLFNDLREHTKQLAETLGAIGWSVTLERSLKTDKHVHGHLYIHLRKAFHRKGPRALDCFSFQGVCPHLEKNTAKGNAYKGAVKYGHFYVFVDKIVSLFSDADFKPFEDYGVEGWWLDNLVKQGKLDRETYLSWAARVTVGFQRRLVDVRAAQRFEREAAVEQAVLEASDALTSQVLPMKLFAQVEKFIDQFRSWTLLRRPMLVIVGGTNLGKSLLAADILKNRIGPLVGAKQYLEVTVEDNEVLDLADFDRRSHAGVILDGVGDALILKRNRESLQGRPKVTKGAKSATNVYAYSYTFTRRAVIATLDLSAANIQALRTDH